MSKVLFMNPDLECAFRLLIACICGGIIGFERSKRNKEAGIRTHVIVAVGAALFVIISKYGFRDIVGAAGVQVDVARVASNVVTGVSFLGAGIINMRGDTIHGLTTAAGIWAAAAIGLSVGSGLYILGVSATILLIVVQMVTHLTSVVTFDKVVTSTIVVTMEDNSTSFYDFCNFMERRGITISGSHIKRHEDMTLTYTLDVHMPVDLTSTDLLSIVKTCNYVKSIEM